MLISYYLHIVRLYWGFNTIILIKINIGVTDPKIETRVNSKAMINHYIQWNDSKWIFNGSNPKYLSKVNQFWIVHFIWNVQFHVYSVTQFYRALPQIRAVIIVLFNTKNVKMSRGPFRGGGHTILTKFNELLSILVLLLE